jgi:flagellar protein FlbD
MAAGGRRKENAMIVLTKRNNERFLINHNQIESIETIPESKIIMMNRDYFIVKESPEDIIKKIQDYNAKVQDVHRIVTVTDKR